MDKCANGHPWDEANTYWYRGRRFCRACRRAGARKRHKTHASHNAEKAKSWRLALKREVMDAYGGVCQCCSEHRLTMLSIDHVGNDGAADRAANGIDIYARLRREGFPPGFACLCFNCNASKHINGGVCEHAA